VSAHVLLIAVVAEPLAAALEHLRRCQATERAGRCSGAGRGRRRRSGWRRARATREGEASVVVGGGEQMETETDMWDTRRRGERTVAAG
jgi:hypothetical protein